MSSEQHMIIVERIVRPIVASHTRKMSMRQELLAHLEASISEELQRGITPEEALVIAQERLGDPVELRSTLQATVPSWFRWNAWMACFAVKKPTESATQFALRSGGTLSLLFAVYLMLAVMIVSWLQGKPLNLLIPEFMIYLAGVFGVTATLVTAISLRITTPLVEANEKPGLWNWPTAWGTLAMGLIFGGAVTALTAWSDWAPLVLVVAAAKGFAGAVILFPIICRLFVEERRQSHPWDRLQIDESAIVTD